MGSMRHLPPVSVALGRAVLATGLVACSLATGSARATNPHGAKVDDRVAQAADTSSASTQIPVIVFGKQVGGRSDPELAVHAQLSPQAAAGTVKAGDLDKLAQEPNVAFIAPNAAVAAFGNGPTSNAFPNLATLYPVVDGAPAAWSQGYDGSGVGIAIVDSGTVRDDFANGRLKHVDGANHGDDTYGHGDLVSHIAAGCCAGGAYVGIAPGATVLSYNVNTPDGARTSDVIEGLLWAASYAQKENVRVVNLSLGETTPSSSQQDLLDTVVESLEQNGILVVAAAGNLGPNSAVFAPANDPFALSVGATDVNGTANTADDTLTPWSTFGTTPDGFAKPNLVAPGRSIVSHLDPSSTLGTQAPAANWVPGLPYASISGTSFSAPQVAGAAAILFQEHPDWTPGQVKWVLENTARPVAGSSVGSLDLQAATSYAGTPPDADAGLTPSQFGLGQWVQDALNGTFHSNSWTSNSWTSNSWTSNSWTSNSWTSNSWTSNSWTSNSWTSNSWTSQGWG